MEPTAVKRAAELVLEHWQDGTHMAAIPADARPIARRDGYAVQSRIGGLAGYTQVGWKIAATSAGGQAHIGVDGPLAGRLFAERAILPGKEASLMGNHMRVAEPEFAFRMGRDLPARSQAYDRAEVMAAVSDLHLAIELPSSRLSRFEQAGAAQLIADNACAHQHLVGPATAPLWRQLDLARHRVRITKDGGVEHHGSGAAVLGDPRDALTWIANELALMGQGLCAGEIIMTGTSTIPLPIAAGDRVVADFGELGHIGLRIAMSD